MRRRPGRITIRHIIAAAAVVLVVNAQLTWWIVFVLGQNRERLELERERLLSACDGFVATVAAREADARAALVAALVAGRTPDEDPAPEPWSDWSSRSTPGCRSGWTAVADGVLMRLRGPADRCVESVPQPAWLAAIRTPPDELELIAISTLDPSDLGLPQFDLGPPLEGFVVRPTAASWQQALDEYRRRIVMMVSEGTFFALLLLAIVTLMWRTLRREVELERQHRNFLSAITHELKSPLAAIRLSLETVIQGRAPGATGSRFLENSLGDTERLENLVQKVLEVTRYGRNGGGIELERGCVSEVIEEVVEMFRGRAMAAHGVLEADIQAEVWGQFDREAMSIAISNLLENAIKYGGEEPRIAVRLFTAEGEAVVEVEDSGPGIPHEEVPLIFNRFYRGGEELTRTAHGTGLGLFLVHRIVAGHGGRVAVHRTGPDGTIFRVQLPGAQVWEETA